MILRSLGLIILFLSSFSAYAMQQSDVTSAAEQKKAADQCNQLVNKRVNIWCKEKDTSIGFGASESFKKIRESLTVIDARRYSSYAVDRALTFAHSVVVWKDSLPDDLIAAKCNIDFVRSSENKPTLAQLIEIYNFMHEFGLDNKKKDQILEGIRLAIFDRRDEAGAPVEAPTKRTVTKPVSPPKSIQKFTIDRYKARFAAVAAAGATLWGAYKLYKRWTGK